MPDPEYVVGKGNRRIWPPCKFIWPSLDKKKVGITSENVAKDYGVSRRKQDEFSALSHVRAAKAQKSGLFDAEIVPTLAVVTDANGEPTGTKLITKVAPLSRFHHHS